jgi:uncharacterized membrane protein
VSSNDWNNQQTPPGADGWVDGEPEDAARRKPRPADFAEPAPQEPLYEQPRHYPIQRRQPQNAPADPHAEMIDEGKPLALFSHLSILFGLPIFMIPLLQRENAFALHHAKAAGVTFILFLMMFVLTFLTCGLAVPLLLLCYIPAIVGLVKASQGERCTSLAFGNLGESIFSSIKLKDERD